MRTTPAWAAVMMCALSVAAAAQDGLRSASLPERGSNATASAERDLFLVPPDFYNRPPDPEASRLFFPQFLPTLVATPYWYGPQYPYVRGPAHFDGRPEATRTRREAISEIPALPSVTLPPMLPGKPKTFYVIPGCYAGDKPPEPEWLRRGCDMSRMRIVPP